MLKATLRVKPPPREEQPQRTADTLGQQIKEKRQALKWSRAKLAREAGVNVQALRMIEEGLATPKPETVRHLTFALEVRREPGLHGPVRIRVDSDGS